MLPDSDSDQTREIDIARIEQYLSRRPDRCRGVLLSASQIYEISIFVCMSNELVRRKRDPRSVYEKTDDESELLTIAEQQYLYARNKLVRKNPLIPVRDTIDIFDEVLFNVSYSFCMIFGNAILTDDLEYLYL